MAPEPSSANAKRAPSAAARRACGDAVQAQLDATNWTGHDGLDDAARVAARVPAAAAALDAARRDRDAVRGADAAYAAEAALEVLPKKLACVLAKHRARRREWALIEAITDGGGVDEDDAAPAAGDADEAFAKAVVDVADAMNAAGSRAASDSHLRGVPSGGGGGARRGRVVYPRRRRDVSSPAAAP